MYVCMKKRLGVVQSECSTCNLIETSLHVPLDRSSSLLSSLGVYAVIKVPPFEGVSLVVR